jgi:hypothetical protein
MAGRGTDTIIYRSKSKLVDLHCRAERHDLFVEQLKVVLVVKDPGSSFLCLSEDNLMRLFGSEK